MHKLECDYLKKILPKTVPDSAHMLIRILLKLKVGITLNSVSAIDFFFFFNQLHPLLQNSNTANNAEKSDKKRPFTQLMSRMFFFILLNSEVKEENSN